LSALNVSSSGLGLLTSEQAEQKLVDRGGASATFHGHDKLNKQLLLEWGHLLISVGMTLDNS